MAPANLIDHAFDDLSHSLRDSCSKQTFEQIAAFYLLIVPKR